MKQNTALGRKANAYRRRDQKNLLRKALKQHEAEDSGKDTENSEKIFD